MSYVIQAVLSNPRRPECDQITIPFPIPFDQYDKTIEMLQAIDLGFSVNRDCTVDEVNSRYSVLNTLVGTLVNIDQLDYLAKRLDGFCAGEVSQFQAMAHKLGLSEIKDFIKVGNWRQAHFFYNCWLVGRIMPMVEYSEPRREQGFF